VWFVWPALQALPSHRGGDRGGGGEDSAVLSGAGAGAGSSGPLALPRFNEGPKWDVARSALANAEAKASACLAACRGVLVARPRPGGPRTEYETIGEGRWAVGRDVAHLVDSVRATALTVDMDELEALVVILERAVAALPTQAEGDQVFRPWNATDQAMATRFSNLFESLVARVVAMTREVDGVTVPRSVGRKSKSHSGMVLAQGQSSLHSHLEGCHKHCDSLALGMQETLRMCDAEGLRSSHRAVEATVADMTGCLDKMDVVRGHWVRLVGLCVTVDTIKTVVPLEVGLATGGTRDCQSLWRWG
jgi:hypothetical protein